MPWIRDIAQAELPGRHFRRDWALSYYPPGGFDEVAPGAHYRLGDAEPFVDPPALVAEQPRPRQLKQLLRKLDPVGAYLLPGSARNSAASLRPLIHDYRRDDDETVNHLLMIAGRVEKVEAIADHAEYEHPDESSLNAALAAGETGASDDDGGDRGQLEARSGVWLPGGDARCQNGASEAGDGAG